MPLPFRVRAAAGAPEVESACPMNPVVRLKDRLRSIRLPALSMKARVALVMTTLFVAAVVFVTAAQMQEIRRSMSDVLSAQQNTLVTRVADEIDEKFRTRQAALAGVAVHLGSRNFEATDVAQAELSAQGALPNLFDHVFLFSTSGSVLANVPFGAQFAKFNIAQRAYFQETIAQRRPIISTPYRSLVDGDPYVMMTSPVFDSDGKVIGIIGGAIGLHKRNFLGSIGTTSVGRSGYFYVISGGERPTIINHPDRSR